MSGSHTGQFASIGELADELIEQSGPTLEFVYVDISSIDREAKRIVDAKTLPLSKAPSRARQVLKAGDVLVSMTRPNLNAVALVPDHLDGAIGSTGFHVLRSKWLRPAFLHFLVQSQEFIDAMCALVQGALYPAVRPKDIAAYQFIFETPAQQTRIVAKLEEILSDLDASVVELKTAQKKLQQYRQSLLKAAVEGALTPSWREAQRTANTPLETGAQLLERILRERRALWEEKQLAKFKKQGKNLPKDWQKKYPEPVAPDTIGLPALPEGWVWATLSQVGWLDRGRSKHRPRNAAHLYGGPYPFVQTGDIRHSDTFISDVEATYSEAGLAQSRLWPIGTMCITIAANIGKTAILSMEACFPDSVVGFLPGTDDVSVRYVEYFMRSVQQKLEDEAPATAQKNINLEILEKVVIPIPPIHEQNQIVEILNRALGAARDIERSIELGFKQSSAQRQNILRAAFAGQLVPQDPNDEPASVLLERIRSERATQATTKKPRGRKTEKAAA
ncbi:restriction endonuclease subunit S [Massilia varians]|uniref:restriction endonuclease subunit S n=1 Tax=Massilia varians TaxID=457921 RepID=UPI002555678C|nr:restriction endonuclease subunit S [Massilia varians]